MITKFVILFLAIISVLAILTVYALKIAHQYQYLRLQAGLKKTDFFEALSLSLKDEKSKKLRNRAIMLFPMFFPIVLDEKKETLNDIKRSIKKLHIIIYILLMVIILVGVYASKIYPNGMFA